MPRSRKQKARKPNQNRKQRLDRLYVIIIIFKMKALTIEVAGMQKELILGIQTENKVQF